MSLPALGNDVSWSVAFSMYSVILGHLGTDAVAANSIVSVVRNIGMVFCFSVASAGSILLGNMMGKGDLEKSKIHASKTLKATVIAGAVGGMIVLAVTPFVLEFATLNDKAMHYLKHMLFINAYYIIGAAVNSVLIAGVFRAGGDTKFGLVCDTIDMWLVFRWIYWRFYIKASCYVGIFFAVHGRVCKMAMGDTSLPQWKVGTEYHKRGFSFVQYMTVYVRMI